MISKSTKTTHTFKHENFPTIEIRNYGTVLFEVWEIHTPSDMESPTYLDEWRAFPDGAQDYNIGPQFMLDQVTKFFNEYKDE